MKIISISKGRQTSSSSSHSILKLKHFLKPRRNFCDDDEYYGWDVFYISDKKSKLKYLLAYLGEDIYNREEFFEELKKYPDLELYVKNNFSEISEAYVDHNTSHSILDVNFGGNIKNFFKILFCIVNDNNLVIHGGNDNISPEVYFSDGEIHEYVLSLSNCSFLNFKETKFGFSCLVSQNMDDYKHFYDSNSESIFLTPKSIQVIRITDNNIFCDLEPTSDSLINFYKDSQKFDVPDFLDIKITDYCERECDYCYQRSTRSGKHCDPEFLKECIDMFIEEQVFQIALGGGEPTTYPKLQQIIEKFSKNTSIIPNITTRKLDEIAKLTPFNCKLGVGLTVDSGIKKDLEIYKVEHMLTNKTQKIPYDIDIQIHLIPELIGMENTLEILENYEQFNSIVPRLCGFLLLGWKTPRNPKIKPRIINWKTFLSRLTEIVRRNPALNIYIDTCLARKMKNLLKENSHPLFWYTSEGIFSKYIDMVEKFVAPSSYETEKRIYFNTVEELRDALTAPIYTT